MAQHVYTEADPCSDDERAGNGRTQDRSPWRLTTSCNICVG